MDLGGIEKHNFSTALLENSRNCHGSPSILTRLLHSGRFQTGCCRPAAVLNGFKPVIAAVTTKLTIADGSM